MGGPHGGSRRLGRRGYGWQGMLDEVGYVEGVLDGVKDGEQMCELNVGGRRRRQSARRNRGRCGGDEAWRRGPLRREVTLMTMPLHCPPLPRVMMDNLPSPLLMTTNSLSHLWIIAPLPTPTHRLSIPLSQPATHSDPNGLT